MTGRRGYTMSDEWALESWGEPEEAFLWESPPLEDEGHYAALRAALREEYRFLEPEQLDGLIQGVLQRLSPEEAEDFWKALGNLGKQVAPVAAQILPVAAPIIGTAIGGPAGGAVGGMLGQFAGQALAGATGQPRPTAPAPTFPLVTPGVLPLTPAAAPPAAPPGTAASPLPAGGTSATAQLLSLMQNPALLQSILGQLLGAAGRGSTPVGAQGIPAPFGAFMNALSVLANQAAAEAHAGLSGDEAQGIPGYLGVGGELADSASSEVRTRALLERLREGRAAEELRSANSGVGEWLERAGMLAETASFSSELVD